MWGGQVAAEFIDDNPLQACRHLPIVCFDNRLEPIPISMKNIGYRPIPIPIPILYEALSLRTAGLNLSLIFSKD